MSSPEKRIGETEVELLPEHEDDPEKLLRQVRRAVGEDGSRVIHVRLDRPSTRAAIALVKEAHERGWTLRWHV